MMINYVFFWVAFPSNPIYFGYILICILAHLGGYSGLSLRGILAFVYAPYAGVPQLVAQHVATVFHLSSGFV
jgi:hypothetical protein